MADVEMHCVHLIAARNSCPLTRNLTWTDWTPDGNT